MSEGEGETWSFSARSDAAGQYELRFYPQAHVSFQVRVASGSTLAAGDDSITFPNPTSVNLDLFLTEDGLGLSGAGLGELLAPETIPGAEYVGVLVGLANAAGPLPVAVTWPDQTARSASTRASDGSFPSTELLRAKLCPPRSCRRTSTRTFRVTFTR